MITPTEFGATRYEVLHNERPGRIITLPGVKKLYKNFYIHQVDHDMIVQQTTQTRYPREIAGHHLGGVLASEEQWQIIKSAYDLCAGTGEPQITPYFTEDGYQSIARIIRTETGFICREAEAEEENFREIIQMLKQAEKNSQAG